MTLILFHIHIGVWESFKLLIVLVTRQDRPEQNPDREANKTIVYEAPDAAVVISYTGISYLEDVPTDQWIAQTLIGRPITTTPDGRPVAFQSLMPRQSWPAWESSFTHLRNEIAETLRRNNPGAGLMIVVAGWRFYRSIKRSRPFISTEAWNADGTSYASASIARNRGCLEVQPNDYLTPDERHTLFESMLGKNAAQIEKEMISRIRMVAARTPHRVGADCMCVMLACPSTGQGRVRYDSPVTRGLSIFPSVVMPIAFTPYIIHQEAVRPASIIGGSEPTQVPLGPYQLVICGTGQRTHRLEPAVFQEGQRRPKKPTA